MEEWTLRVVYDMNSGRGHGCERRILEQTASTN